MNVSAVSQTQTVVSAAKQNNPVQKAENKPQESHLAQDVVKVSAGQRMKTSIWEGVKFETKVHGALGATTGGVAGAFGGAFLGAAAGNPMAGLATGAVTGILAGGLAGAASGAVSGAIDGAVVGLTDSKGAARLTSALTGAGTAVLSSLAQGKTSKGALLINAAIGAGVGAWVGGHIYDNASAKLAAAANN